MRKTSIDEMPQFFNVPFGDMLWWDPRPHLWSQNLSYANKKNAIRHCVKPSITGLAQVSGFRGNRPERDMINRIKFDVFISKIGHWFLKIIYQTILNIYKEKKKAYKNGSILVFYNNSDLNSEIYPETIGS
jgi:putative colanic acid biosynthesis UDP-glucose lipid carrier transferase